MKKNLMYLVKNYGWNKSLNMMANCRFFINIIFLEVLILLGLTIGNEFVKGVAGIIFVLYLISYRGIQDMIRYYLLNDDELEYLYEHRNEVDE